MQMAKREEIMAEVQQMLDDAEGYMTDAEFREEMDVKNSRYFQAMSHLLMALTRQNQIIMRLLREIAGEDVEEE
jgi:hypothetical protein